jgi:pimeloyl-ACP methyl ester carboxylesterase
MAGQATARDAPDRSRAVLVANAPLLVHEWGPPGATPVLFWHALGLPLNGLFFGEVARVLAEEHACHVIAPDAPGFGGSPALPLAGYRPSAIARLFVNLADALGWPDFHLIGHSWGATIGCHVSAQSPERLRSLTLLDAGYLPARPEWSDAAATLQRARSWTSEFRFPSWEALDGQRDPDARRWSTWLTTATAAGMRRGSDGAIVPVLSPEIYTAVSTGVAAEPPASVHGRMKQGRVRTLLIRATQPSEDEASRAAAAEAFARAVPQARVHAAHGCGHDVIVDLGPQLAHLLADWLQRDQERLAQPTGQR